MLKWRVARFRSCIGMLTSLTRRVFLGPRLRVGLLRLRFMGVVDCGQAAIRGSIQQEKVAQDRVQCAGGAGRVELRARSPMMVLGAWSLELGSWVCGLCSGTLGRLRFEFTDALVEVADLYVVAVEPCFVAGGLLPEALLSFGGFFDLIAEFGGLGDEDRELAVDHEHPGTERQQCRQDNGDDDFVFFDGHGKPGIGGLVGIGMGCCYDAAPEGFAAPAADLGIAGLMPGFQIESEGGEAAPCFTQCFVFEEFIYVEFDFCEAVEVFVGQAFAGGHGGHGGPGNTKQFGDLAAAV